MILFFVIVFIAELVLTIQLIILIRNWDRKVCALNEQITQVTPEIEKSLTQIRIVINKVLLKLNKIQIKIEKEKNKYKNIILKHFITGVLYLILHGRWKKIFSIIEIVFSANDIINKGLKLAHSLKK